MQWVSFFVCFLLSFSSFPTHIYLSWEWERKNDGEVRKDGKEGVFFREMIVVGVVHQFWDENYNFFVLILILKFEKLVGLLSMSWKSSKHHQTVQKLANPQIIHNIEFNPSSHPPKRYIFILFYSYFNKKIFSQGRDEKSIFSHQCIVSSSTWICIWKMSFGDNLFTVLFISIFFLSYFYFICFIYFFLCTSINKTFFKTEVS